MNRYRITFAEWTIAFVSFGVLLSVALLYAETQPDVGFARTVYTIWATAVLVTPALCAFALPGGSDRKHAVWLLFWTSSFVVYIVHLLYAVFSVYEGSFKEFLAGQGVFPAINNVIFTVWWAFDLFLAWSSKKAHWIDVQRIWAHWYIGLTFVASTVFLKHGFINVLGIILTASTIICLMIRFDARRAAVSPTS